MGPREGAGGRSEEPEHGGARPRSEEGTMLKRGVAGAIVLLVAAVGVGQAQTVPGATVEERAVNGAKAYLKKLGVEKLDLTMMMVSLFAKAQPKYLDEWEKLTGIRIKT